MTHLVRYLARAAAAVTLLLIASAFAIAIEKSKLDVPYVPTPEAVVEQMLRMANVQPGEYVIDLGSGDGRIAIAAAKRYKARALGVDIDPERVAEANANAKQEGVADRVTFRVQDLFKTDISKADVLTMYLLSSVNLKLRPRILDELRPGTRVVSHAFDMDEWKPDARATVADRNVYYWVVPAKVQGNWTFHDGETKLTVNIDQAFQRFTGTAQSNGRSLALESGRINGTEIHFTIAGRTYRGEVDGDSIQGKDGGGTGSWRATRSAT